MYIGIDIGTTGTKALLYDDRGNVHHKSYIDYSIITPAPDRKEQNPEVLFNAVIEVLKDVVGKAKYQKETIEFISFSSMMHSLIAVDENGMPLTNCIIWADGRSAEYAKRFKDNGKGNEIYKRTGTPCHPMSPFYKIMWLQDNDRGVFDKTAKFISIKEYIIYKFFGEYIVDYSIASATGLFNIETLQWDNEAVQLAGITVEQLSRPVSTTYKIRGLKQIYVDQLGVGQDCWFVLGGSDGCLANLGSKGIEEGAVVITIGTSGAVRIISDKPIIDNEGRTFCYVLTDNTYVAGGSINNGGMVYQWFRDTFAVLEVEASRINNKNPYYYLNEMIKETDAGSNGLLFIPFVTGERAPYWNSNLRGSYMGISAIHQKRHFARAVMEGVSFAINDVFMILKEQTSVVNHIYVNGGFTKSKIWVQILCDILGIDITVSDNYESPSLGAYMLGMLSLGKVKNLAELHYILEDGECYKVSGDHKIYKELFQIYKGVIKHCSIDLEQLADFQKRTSN